jgi:hypothetical protein
MRAASPLLATLGFLNVLKPLRGQGKGIRLQLTVIHRCCPHCKSIEFRGVGPRNAMERAVHWLLLPYRCDLCGHHFFLMRWLAPVEGTA